MACTYHTVYTVETVNSIDLRYDSAACLQSLEESRRNGSSGACVHRLTVVAGSAAPGLKHTHTRRIHVKSSNACRIFNAYAVAGNASEVPPGSAAFKSDHIWHIARILTIDRACEGTHKGAPTEGAHVSKSTYLALDLLQWGDAPSAATNTLNMHYCTSK